VARVVVIRRRFEATAPTTRSSVADDDKPPRRPKPPGRPLIRLAASASPMRTGTERRTDGDRPPTDPHLGGGGGGGVGWQVCSIDPLPMASAGAGLSPALHGAPHFEVVGSAQGVPDGQHASLQALPAQQTVLGFVSVFGTLRQVSSPPQHSPLLHSVKQIGFGTKSDCVNVVLLPVGIGP
jgi:hypothetical protein